MLRSRLLILYSRARAVSTVVDPSPQGSRLYLFQNTQFRTFSEGTNNRNRKLAKVSVEDDQALRRSWGNIVIPTALIVIAGAGLYIHHNDEKRAILKGSDQNAISERKNISGPVIGGPFKLHDQDNRLVTESSFRGKWILMYFGYTSSPDVGPEEVRKMAEVVNILESKNHFTITPVFITIDPQRDTSAQLKAYLKEFDPRIIGLTGPIAAVRQMAQEYRIYFKKVDEEGQDYLVESSNNIYLLDPNMEIRRSFSPEYDTLQLTDAILTEVKKASKDH